MKPYAAPFVCTVLQCAVTWFVETYKPTDVIFLDVRTEEFNPEYETKALLAIEIAARYEVQASLELPHDAHASIETYGNSRRDFAHYSAKNIFRSIYAFSVDLGFQIFDNLFRSVGKPVLFLPTGAMSRGLLQAREKSGGAANSHCRVNA